MNQNCVTTAEGLLPEGFSPQTYLEVNPDVAQAGHDPVAHYRSYGRDEGRHFRKVPSLWNLLPPGFDVHAYMQLNPDIPGTEQDAALHYLRYGAAEGRPYQKGAVAGQATPGVSDVVQALLEEVIKTKRMHVEMLRLPIDFDAATYLALNPDLQAAGVDPAVHYLESGHKEGRVYKQACLDHEKHARLAKLPEGFDGAIYLELNPDLRAAGVMPVDHYLVYGCGEGRAYRHPEPVRAEDLPKDFDAELYLRLNPDLVGLDGAQHFANHGRAEGRKYTFPELEFLGEESLQAGRETLLVVSHEASLTGAPVLSLNLVQALVGRYNIVALMLGGGVLQEAFLNAGSVVLSVPGARENPVFAEFVVERLCQRFALKLALINSIESRVVLAPLSAAFVPTISLLHEFASYTRPRDAFRIALFWSTDLVFSAKVTRENAFAEYPDLGERSAHVLPQGRCLVPARQVDPLKQEAERARLRRQIRPAHAKDAVIVLGAGFVQLRKGVELFVDCAAQVLRMPGGDRCRFVWIGKGYDPDHDTAYSVYLADMIRRAGLQDHVVFVPETTVIETAYEEADMLLLSSRLDPLPNVAIDAMAFGLPVLCFDKTTGIADFLAETGLKDACVGDYLDTPGLSVKLLALAVDDRKRQAVGELCRVASLRYFSMERYIESIETLAQEVALRSSRERADMQMILDSGLFKENYAYATGGGPNALRDSVRKYVRAWASGIDRKMPFPGFHPGIYEEVHGVEEIGGDPFVDYLRAGRPHGPWMQPVVSASPPTQKLPADVRAALHLHVYYVDLLPEMLMALAVNRIKPDLFISIANEDARESVEKALTAYGGKVAEIRVVGNRGRDIGPFLSAFGKRLVAEYDFIGHLHTKKSLSLADTQTGATWYRFSLEHLLGGLGGAMMDGIISALAADPTMGMVVPGDPNVLGLNNNRVFAQALAQRVGLDHMPEHFMFPVGSMFWARSNALAALVGLDLDWCDYPEEPVPYDGTILHAIERMFGLCLPLTGQYIAITAVEGVTR